MIRRNAIAALALMLAAVTVGGSACAMNSAPTKGVGCTVDGSEKLPPDVGGEQGVCAAITAAMSPALEDARIPATAIWVSVKVKSDSTMSAVASVNGRPLPEQTVGISDRPLNRRAVDMLGAALAAALSGARG